MPLKALRKAILIKVEATYATDATPVAGTDAMLVRNWNFSPLNLAVQARQQVLIYFGGDGQLIAGKYAQVSFEVELAGAGAAGTAPKYAPALKACALSETVNAGTSVVYAPISSGEQSATIYFYQDGILHKLVGARGTCVVSMQAGNVPVLQFTLVGLYVAVSDAALATPTLTGFQKPLIVNNANTTPFTFDSYAGVLSTLSLDIGNQMKYRNLVGSEYVVFMDRQSKGSLMMEKPLIGTKDYYTIANAGTTKALSITHGTTSGNKVVVAAGQAQIISVAESDQDGIAMLTLGLDVQPSTAGNDEFSITVQ